MASGTLNIGSGGAYASAGDATMAKENDQYLILERAVKASEAHKKEEERQRRIEMGLPPEEEKPSLASRVWRKIKGQKDEDSAGVGSTEAAGKDVVR